MENNEDLNGEMLPLTQVGNGRLYFDEPVSLPPSSAKVVVEVDGEARYKDIVIIESNNRSRVVQFRFC